MAHLIVLQVINRAGRQPIQGVDGAEGAVLVAAQAEVVAQLRDAMAVQDSEAAARSVHTLKGLAGNIAATDLVRTAVALEQGLRKGMDAAALAPLLVHLETVRAAQAEAIRLALPQDPSDSPPTGTVLPDVAQLASVCQQLLALLRNDDGHAERVLAEHADMLRMAYPLHFSDLQAAVNRFDSERGLEILQQAMSTAPS